MKSEELDDKTQCQLCKRLAYSSFLVWKRVSSMDMVVRVQLTTIFLCIEPFLTW